MKEEKKNAIDRLTLFIPEEHQEEAKELLAAILESAQDEVFLDGYRYAAAVLNDGLTSKGRQNI